MPPALPSALQQIITSQKNERVLLRIFCAAAHRAFLTDFIFLFLVLSKKVNRMATKIFEWEVWVLSKLTLAPPAKQQEGGVGPPPPTTHKHTSNTGAPASHYVCTLFTYTVLFYVM